MNKSIRISDLTIKQKIFQMIIIRSNFYNKSLSYDFGGFFFTEVFSKEILNTINEYQNFSKIKLFISTDLEGYVNNLKNFYTCKNFGNVKNKEEAYSLGKEQGVILHELGFNLNFSPVVESRNEVWPGRTFKGSTKEIKEKIVFYIKGLKEQQIITTAKHYPGGSMIKDPHKLKFKTKIFKEDLDLFDIAINAGVDSIMIGHPIVFGVVNSNEKPSTISSEVIFQLRKKFNGLIITDSIDMAGLMEFYNSNLDNIYIDLINSGNDIILDLIESNNNKSLKNILNRIENVEKAINNGEISEERINESVRRILNAKGYDAID